MDTFGFSLAREWVLTPPPETRGFVNKAFAFTRADSREAGPAAESP